MFTSALVVRLGIFETAADGVEFVGAGRCVMIGETAVKRSEEAVDSELRIVAPRRAASWSCNSKSSVNEPFTETDIVDDSPLARIRFAVIDI